MLRLEKLRRELDRVLSNRWITLRLDSWGIGLEGVELVAKSLCDEQNNITWLNLYGNGLGDQGVLILSRALIDPNNKVNVLGLWDNNISDDGAIVIAQTLEHPNCNVTLLDIQDNTKITSRGVKAIETAIKRRSCLETIMLPRTIESKHSHELGRIIRIANCQWIRLVACLLSVRQIPRISGSSKLRILPNDLIRILAAMIHD